LSSGLRADEHVLPHPRGSDQMPPGEISSVGIETEVDTEAGVMRPVTSHVAQAYRSSPFRGNRVAPMRRGSWPNELFSRRFDRRTLRMTDIAAGTVVTAPTAISAAPIARRRSAVNRSDISKPIPTPRAARVVTMNPNVGRSSRTFFIATPWSNGGWRKPAAKQGLASGLRPIGVLRKPCSRTRFRAKTSGLDPYA